MAFIDGSGNIVVDNNGTLVHKSFNRLTGTIQSTETKITASDGAGADFFGGSVAVGSGRIVVGARYDSDAGSSSGSAYIFDLNGTQIVKITGSDIAQSSTFGSSVAVGSERIVVGADGQAGVGFLSGAAYIFDLDGNELAKITASDAAAFNFFGRTVAVGCGRIVVGNIVNSAYIFDLNGNQLAKITASDAPSGAGFGQTVAVGSGRIVVGAVGDDDNGTDSGAVYIFDLDGNEITKITASDGAADDSFGYSVAAGSGRIVVGSFRDDDNALNSGSVYIFDLNGNEITKITASDGAEGDFFGESVAVGSGRIVVGVDGDDDAGSASGSAYIFDLEGNQLAKITASDAAAGDKFGVSVAVSSGRIVVGADGDSDNGANSGSAYIYKLDENYDTFIERQLGY